MPEHSELEIDSVISRQNVAKEGWGWTTYYVDGENGNDANNGLRWETAFKTIQHAVDVAESWAKIFIRNGTYYENITIPLTKSSLMLIGESWKGVTITSDSTSLDVISSSNFLTNLYLKSTGEHVAAEITGGRNIIKNCFFESSASGYSALFLAGDDNFVSRCQVSGNTKRGISLSGSRNEISYSRVLSTDRSISLQVGAEDSLIHDCDFLNASNYAIYSAAGTNNLFYHNNFINNTHSIYDNGHNLFVENYYDDHSNIDNGFGIATDPYTFTGGSDPRPVVHRNGWLTLSWADADQVAAGIDTLLARLGSPTTSIAGDIATVDSVADSILANQKKYWHWDAISGDYEVIEGTWAWASDTDQALGGWLRNSSNANHDEIRIPFYVPSTDARTLNLRIRTGSQGGIVTVYVDNSSQGTVDFYSSSTGYNVIKTLSITPARAGMNVFKLEVSGKNASSGGYYCYLSEMWLS